MVLSGLSWASDLQTVNQQLDRLEKSVFALRKPAEGTTLHFQSDGTMIGVARTGTFVKSSLIYVESLSSDGKHLQLDGRRCIALYDWRKRQLTNAVMKDKIKVQVEVAGGTWKDAESALSAVFMTQELQHKMSSYFVPNFAASENWDRQVREHANPIGMLEGSPVYRVIENEVLPPKLTLSRPNPGIPLAKPGSVVFYVIVDDKGIPALLSVSKSDDVALDLAALEGISRWRYSPGITKDAPVATMITVEVKFSRIRN